LLTRGWEELGDTKKQVCDLAQSQYDTIRRLKQLESELKKRVDCNLELERTIEEERKERKELSQAKAEMDWQLSSYQKQVSALSECNEKLERVLRDKESVIEEQARLAFRGQQITSTVQELQNYVGMENAQCNDFLQLHLVIKI
jgi:chromosome segregation ATPase